MREDLFEGKYSPDLGKQKEFEVQFFGNEGPVLTRQCRDWSHQIDLAGHPCGLPGPGRISVKKQGEESLESGDQRKRIFEKIYEDSVW